jgi:hypothetical protein
VLLHVKASNKLSKSAAIEGPYRLVKYISDVQALLEEGKGRQWAVAINRLSPFLAK